MSTALAKDTVESVFKQIAGDCIDKTQSLTVGKAVDLVIDFFTNYEIETVDLAIPENDMLLFEYGIYDWQDGKGENFTIDITRQFYIETDKSNGFSQLHLMLFFDAADFRQIEAGSKWSFDFESLERWKEYILNTDCFKLTESKTPKTYDIFLTETD